MELKPSLSTEILSINDFITKLLRDLSNMVHLESISKFTNKISTDNIFVNGPVFLLSIYKNSICTDRNSVEAKYC